MEKFYQRLITTCADRRFFLITIGLFVISGLIFVVTVNTPSVISHDGPVTEYASTVAPDEHRHIGNIFYFAQRSLLSGPIISDIGDKGHLWMGEIERFPSYLYLYLMSFPAKLFMALGASDQVSIIMLRIITLAIGVYGLTVFRKLLYEAKTPLWIANLTTLMLSQTGVYVWLSAAVNYDIPSLCLFLLMLLFLVRFIKDHPKNFYYALIMFFLVSITKYTYLPFGAMAILLAVLYKTEFKPSLFKDTLKNIFLSYPKIVSKAGIILSLIIIVSGGLFSERILANLIQYKSVNPVCSKVHTVNECKNFTVFDRNYNREQEIQTKKDANQPATPSANELAVYPISWIIKYAKSIYFYRAEAAVSAIATSTLIIGFLVGLIFITSIFTAKKPILNSRLQKYLISVSLLTLIAIFIFNLRSYIHFDAFYAHQGRYLLSVIGFGYLIGIYGLNATVKKLLQNRQIGRVILILISLIILVFIILHNPLVSYFTYANENVWYADWFLKSIGRD